MAHPFDNQNLACILDKPPHDAVEPDPQGEFEGLSEAQTEGKNAIGGRRGPHTGNDGGRAEGDASCSNQIRRRKGGEEKIAAGTSGK